VEEVLSISEKEAKKLRLEVFCRAVAKSAEYYRAHSKKAYESYTKSPRYIAVLNASSLMDRGRFLETFPLQGREDIEKNATESSILAIFDIWKQRKMRREEFTLLSLYAISRCTWHRKRVITDETKNAVKHTVSIGGGIGIAIAFKDAIALSVLASKFIDSVLSQYTNKKIFPSFEDFLHDFSEGLDAIE
jgi:hypothetical protein